MGRAAAALLGVVAPAILLASCSSSTPEPGKGPTALETASLTMLADEPAPPPPSAKFERTIYATSSLARSELMLDFCRGPIAIDVGDHRPVLVAEHDYCGGLEWIPRLDEGEAVALSGDGVEDGTYVVATIEHVRRGHTKVRDLPPTDVVLQTCVSPEKMVLVGMKRFDPTLAS